MTDETRPGRPRASSRETLAEAACELFLERGFGATTVADITARAGVSRSSFFNYFASKSAVLWSGLDERLAVLERTLANAAGEDAVAAAVVDVAADFTPDSLALAIVNETAMGLGDDLERESSARAWRVARAVSPALVRSGVDRLEADVRAAAWGGAVLAAVSAWARAGAGTSDLHETVVRAAAVARAH